MIQKHTFSAALHYAKSGEYDRAIKEFNRSLQLKPDNAIAYTNRGIVCRNKGDVDQSINDFNRAVIT